MTWGILYAIGWLITAPVLARAIVRDIGKIESEPGDEPRSPLP